MDIQERKVVTEREVERKGAGDNGEKNCTWQIRMLEMGVQGDPPRAETWRGEGSPPGQRNPSCRGPLSTTHGYE